MIPSLSVSATSNISSISLSLTSKNRLELWHCQRGFFLKFFYMFLLKQDIYRAEKVFHYAGELIFFYISLLVTCLSYIFLLYICFFTGTGRFFIMWMNSVIVIFSVCLLPFIVFSFTFVLRLFMYRDLFCCTFIFFHKFVCFTFVSLRGREGFS